MMSSVIADQNHSHQHRSRRGSSLEQEPSLADNSSQRPSMRPSQGPETGDVNPFLACLSFVAGHLGRVRSVASLAADLPYRAGGANLSDLVKAAEDNGFQTTLLRRDLDRLSDMVLPAIVLTRDRSAFVLLDRQGSAPDGRVTWHVFLPETNQIVAMDPVIVTAQYGGVVVVMTNKPVLSNPHDHNNHDPSVDDVSGDDATGMRGWLRASWRGHSWSYAQIVMASVMINLFALTLPLTVMNVYDRVLPNNALETGWVLSLGAATVFLFDFAIRGLRAYFIDLAGRKSDLALSARIYDRVLGQTMGASRRSSGAMSSLPREIASVRDFFASATLASLVDFPFALFFLLVIALLSPALAGAVLVLMGAIVVMAAALQGPIRRHIAQSQQADDTQQGILVETLVGLETIKATGGEAVFRRKFFEAASETALQAQKTRALGSIGIHGALLIQQLTSVVVILFGMHLVADGAISVGALMGIMMLAGRAIAPLSQAVSLAVRWQQTRSALKVLDSVIRLPQERKPSAPYLHRPRLSGQISLENVNFHYPGVDRPALRDISLSIKAHQRVGIVGRVGSGKSTLIRLLVGLYQPESGAVLVDDTDLRQIDPADLRRNIAFVPQDPVLFRGTLRDNIALGRPDARDEAILAAAETAGVHAFASRHPRGYDMFLGERGEGLSGGQRQAVALARALLSDAPVLILDEPTNAMDVPGEDALRRRLEPWMRNRTLILVTHRPSILSLVDRLIVLDGGLLVADGPRDEVVAALAAGKIKGAT